MVDANREKQAEWLEKVSEAEAGSEARVPIFPVGDSILEPFWPQVGTDGVNRRCEQEV